MYRSTRLTPSLGIVEVMLEVPTGVPPFTPGSDLPWAKMAADKMKLSKGHRNFKRQLPCHRHAADQGSEIHLILRSRDLGPEIGLPGLISAGVRPGSPICVPEALLRNIGYKGDAILSGHGVRRRFQSCAVGLWYVVVVATRSV